MKRIKIINGTYGFRPSPGIVEPKTKDDPAFCVSDEEAARLINLGVAEIAGEDAEVPKERFERSGAGAEAPAIGNVESTGAGDTDDRPYYSADSDVKELRKIAKEVGITLKVGMSKKDMVKALDAYFDEQMPDLTAATPVK